MQKIKYLITDVDGVIFDTVPTILAAGAKIMQSFGISKELVYSYAKNSLGAPIECQIRGFMAKTGKSINYDEVMELVKNFWNELENHPVELFPGVKETLDGLKTRGIIILASTGSNTAKTRKLFEKFGLPYDFSLGSDEIMKGDAHIEIFAKHFSIPKNVFCRQAAFVGDGTVDMEIAARNRIFGIGITNSIPAAPLLAAGAKVIVSEFKEISFSIESDRIK